MIVVRDGNKFLRSPFGKLIYPTTSFKSNLADLALYKIQIRWFEKLHYWFRNSGNFYLARESKKLAKKLQKKLQDIAR
jgi:uncharacterized C2H2 Zn-finger protein